MAPRTFDVKFTCGTQLTFRSLTFAVEEDGDLKMLPPGSALGHLALASLSTSGGSFSGSDPCARSYIRTVKIVRGISVVTSIFRPLVGHRANLHRHRPLIKIHLMTTLRSGPAPARNPRKAVVLSAWWSRMVTDRTTPPTDIPPSGNQRRPTPEHRAAAWSGI
jgi:hypothetical protein